MRSELIPYNRCVLLYIPNLSQTIYIDPSVCAECSNEVEEKKKKNVEFSASLTFQLSCHFIRRSSRVSCVIYPPNASYSSRIPAPHTFLLARALFPLRVGSRMYCVSQTVSDILSVCADSNLCTFSLFIQAVVLIITL